MKEKDNLIIELSQQNANLNRQILKFKISTGHSENHSTETHYEPSKDEKFQDFQNIPKISTSKKNTNQGIHHKRENFRESRDIKITEQGK